MAYEKCIHDGDKSMARTIWSCTTQTLCFGEYLCRQYLRPQCIRVHTTVRICRLPEIKWIEQFCSCSTCVKSWSTISKKSQVWPKLIGRIILGRRQHFDATKQFDCPPQKSTYSQTQCCVLENERIRSNWRRNHAIQVEKCPGIHNVDSTLHTSLFLMQWTRTDCCTSHCMAQECVGARHVIYMVIHVVRLSVCSLTLCSSPCSFPCVSPISSSSTWTLTCTSSSMWTSSGQYPTGTPPTEVDDETIGRALSSPLFIQGESAGRRLTYHSLEESLLPSQSLSLCHVRTGIPVHELSSQSSCNREKPSREMENKQIRILLERQKKSKFSLILEPRFRITSFNPILIGEVFRNWMELSSLSEEKLIMLLQEMNNFDEINYFMNNYPKKIGIFVKVIWKVLMRWKNRWIFEKKIDRKSRHYLWTHGQNSGTTEWS